MAKVDISKIMDCFLFKDLDEKEIEVLASLFYEKKLSAGKTVFVEQMPGESLYLIKSGRVKISKLIAEGDEKVLVTLNQQDVFGEMAILDGAPRSATARVEDDAVLLSIKKSDFEKLCAAKPKIALTVMRNIIKVFSSRIRENNEEYREMLMWSLSEPS
jgi:CRP-like cAMP-binding protein